MSYNIQNTMYGNNDEQAQRSQMMEQTADTRETVIAETDPLWDCWYDSASEYEPETGKYDEPISDIFQKVQEYSQEMLDNMVIGWYKGEITNFEKRHASMDLEKRIIWLDIPPVYACFETDIGDYCEYCVAYVLPDLPCKSAKRAERRNATSMHKDKIRLNVSEIWESIKNLNVKRENTDLILRKALNANEVPEELRDEIAKYFGLISK